MSRGNFTSPSTISVHRPQNKPMASAYSDLPYVATMFRNILRLGVIC